MANSNKPTVSVAIPTVRPTYLGDAVKSIVEQTFQDWDLWIIGQGRNPDLKRVATAWTAKDNRIHYIHCDKRGISTARNAAIQHSSGAILAFTDDDCVADANWLAEVANCFADNVELDAVFGSLIAPPEYREGQFLVSCPSHLSPDYLYDPKTHPGGPPSNFNVAGANFAVTRRAFDQIGLFDPVLGAGTNYAASEDTDLVLRLEAAGAKMLSTPKSKIHHTHGTRKGLKSMLVLQRNYARGSGALAAKLTLQGDPRGKDWLEARQAEVWNGAGSLKWLLMLPQKVRKYRHFRHSYLECLERYYAAGGVLLAKCSIEQPSTE
jgi:GT2 family glycosyltransferase